MRSLRDTVPVTWPSSSITGRLRCFDASTQSAAPPSESVGRIARMPVSDMLNCVATLGPSTIEPALALFDSFPATCRGKWGHAATLDPCVPQPSAPESATSAPTRRYLVALPLHHA